MSIALHTLIRVTDDRPHVVMIARPRQRSELEVDPHARRRTKGNLFFLLRINQVFQIRGHGLCVFLPAMCDVK